MAAKTSLFTRNEDLSKEDDVIEKEENISLGNPCSECNGKDGGELNNAKKNPLKKLSRMLFLFLKG